jgi:hypothetical protein
VSEETEITRDTLLRGRVKLLQPRHGFRSSLDPVLLAGFIAPPFGRFLDIGCASGALSFLLLAQRPGSVRDREWKFSHAWRPWPSREPLQKTGITDRISKP